jgi:hypothetical protein
MNKQIEYKVGDLFQKPWSYQKNIYGLLISIDKSTAVWTKQEQIMHTIEWYGKDGVIDKLKYHAHELESYCLPNAIYGWKHIPQ